MNPAEAFLLSLFNYLESKKRRRGNMFPQKPLRSAGMNNIFI